jgi:hypothetical protein
MCQHAAVERVTSSNPLTSGWPEHLVVWKNDLDLDARGDGDLGCDVLEVVSGLSLASEAMGLPARSVFCTRVLK